MASKETKKAREVLRDMGRQKKSRYEDEAKELAGQRRYGTGPRTEYVGKQGKFRMKKLVEPKKAPKGLGKALVVQKVLDEKRDERDPSYDLTRQIAKSKSFKDVAGVKAGKKGAKTKPPVEYVKDARKARRDMARAKAQLVKKKITLGQYNDVLRKYGYGPSQGSFTPQDPDFPYGKEGNPGKGIYFDKNLKDIEPKGYSRKRSAKQIRAHDKGKK